MIGTIWNDSNSKFCLSSFHLFRPQYSVSYSYILIFSYSVSCFVSYSVPYSHILIFLYSHILSHLIPPVPASIYAAQRHLAHSHSFVLWPSLNVSSLHCCIVALLHSCIVALLHSCIVALPEYCLPQIPTSITLTAFPLQIPHCLGIDNAAIAGKCT